MAIDFFNTKDMHENCIFVIPARKNSKGLPFKNRALFEHTAKTIPLEFSSKVVVTSDDWNILQAAEEYGFETIHRDRELSDDDISIKDVLLDVKFKKQLDNTDIVMLYLTYPQRTFDDVLHIYNAYRDFNGGSLLCRKEVKTHPYMCYVDLGNNLGKKAIEHDLCRRQDYPKYFEACHYVAIVNSDILEEVDRNLYHPKTIFCPLEFKRDPIDVDTIDDYKNFLNMDHPESPDNILPAKQCVPENAKFLLLSAERSGNTWLRYCLEYIFKEPTIGYGPEDDPLLIHFDMTPLALKRHSWNAYEEMDIGYKAYNKTILLIRDYKEIYFRRACGSGISRDEDGWWHDYAKSGLNIRHFKLCLQGDHSGLEEMTSNIKKYDYLNTPKMVVYYEDLIESPEPTLKKIKDFIIVNSDYDSSQIEKINHDFLDFIGLIDEQHSPEALKRYRDGGMGREVKSLRNAKHENLKNTVFYSSFHAEYFRQLIDLEMRKYIGERLYSTYLERYMEQRQ